MSVIEDLIAKFKEFTIPQQIFIAVVLAIALILTLIFVGVIPGRRGSGVEDIDLTVWIVDDNRRSFESLVGGFSKVYPHIKVSYLAVEEERYEEELISALAAGEGPDVFLINNKWLPVHINKISPAPKDKIAANTFRGLFPKVAEQDFMREESVYAMPLYIDTLALVYNKDIYDKNGIPIPPASWVELSQTVPKITSISEEGDIVNPAVALGGTSDSITNASDILSLLFVQKGVLGGEDQNEVARIAATGGEQAVDLYTSFATPSSTLYTWSDKMGSDISAFAKGDLASIIIYSAQLEAIKKQNPFLNIGVAEIPQFDPENPATFANYWGIAVSNRTENKEAAWDFAIFMSTDQKTATEYASATGHPPALRFLIDTYINSPGSELFAKQALIARSWPQPNVGATEEIFDTMIEDILENAVPIRNSISQASSKLNRLIRR